MKLYLLTLIESHSLISNPYDKYHAKVIQAKSPKGARKIANERTGDEGAVWEDPEQVSVRQIGISTRKNPTEGVILADFHAG